jgi:hypothetical protein
MNSKYGYIALYKGKRLEIYSDKGIYPAQVEAAKQFKAKKVWEVHIVLAERPDGTEVVHTATT